MNEIIEFISTLIAGWGQLPLVAQVVAVLVALHPVASAIVAFTDTPKDDKLLAKAYKWIEILALITQKAKQKNKKLDT